MASVVLLLTLLGGGEATFRSQPVVEKVPSTLAELKQEENKLVDKLFIVAEDTVFSELQKIRTRTTDAKVAGAPAGAPGGAPGKPPFGQPKKAYMGIKPEMKAKT